MSPESIPNNVLLDPDAIAKLSVTQRVDCFGYRSWIDRAYPRSDTSLDMAHAQIFVNNI